MAETANSHPRQDNSLGQEKVVIPVTGMTCAFCVAHVTQALEEVPGVKGVQVNLVTEQASVEFEPGRIGLGDLEKAIRDTGYRVGWDTALLQITGLTCASCVGKIQAEVGDLPGVSKIAVNLTSSTGRVATGPV